MHFVDALIARRNVTSQILAHVFLGSQLHLRCTVSICLIREWFGWPPWAGCSLAQGVLTRVDGRTIMRSFTARTLGVARAATGGAPTYRSDLVDAL